MEITSGIEEYLRQGESIPGLAVVFAGSLLEYVFPPFPGDTIVLMGAFLAAWAAWTPWKVLAVTLAGALAGAWIDTIAGRMLRNHLSVNAGLAPPHASRLAALVRKPSFQAGVKKVIEKFEKHGTWIILANRFFPGIRAFFFVGAGMASIPMWKVLACGGASAMLWNAAVFIAGYEVGNNWDALLRLFNTYTHAAYVLIAAAAAAAAAAIALKAWKGKKRRRESRPGGDAPG